MLRWRQQNHGWHLVGKGPPGFVASRMMKNKQGLCLMNVNAVNARAAHSNYSFNHQKEVVVNQHSFIHDQQQDRRWYMAARMSRLADKKKHIATMPPDRANEENRTEYR